MRLEAAQEGPILAWLAEVHGVYVLQQPRVVYTVLDGLQIRGAYVLTWRNDFTAELHVYGTVTPETTRTLFETAFLGHYLHRLEVITSRENRRIRRAAPKFGFKFECVKRDYYGPGNDGFLYAMTADQCRWTKGHDDGISVLGQPVRAEDAASGGQHARIADAGPAGDAAAGGR